MQVKQRLDALTSLRFFAAAMIVLGHADIIFGSFGIAQAVPLNQGVSFFFVLSGFILTWNYPVLANWAERRKFFLARFARIWPLHLVTCLLWIALIFNFDRTTNFPGLAGLVKLIANLLLLQVWVPLHDWVLSFNGVAWSISAEFFFYAMFPLLISLWSKRWHQLLLIQALVILMVITAMRFHILPWQDETLVRIWSYFNPLVRIFEFSIGIALATLVRKLSKVDLQMSGSQWFALEIAAVLFIVIGLLVAAKFYGIEPTFGSLASYYFNHEGLWIFWAILIGVFALSHGPLTRLLSLRFAVFLGEISFALYLCHALVIHYLENYTEKVQSYGLPGYIIFWAWCLTLAAILFIGIETPFRKVILALAARQKINVALKMHFQAKEMAALGLLLSMAAAMFFLKPSTILKLDQENVAEFMRSAPESISIPSGVGFDKRYEIVAMRMHAIDNEKTQVEVLLRSATELWAHDTLVIHVIDQDGKLIANAGQILDQGRALLPAGTYWVQKFQLPKSSIEKGYSFGIAMYNKPAALFDGVGGERDWGGKRLILPINR